jgi:uncharacterized protein YdeI (YjbR/CyaY-like superfamily)
MPGPRAIKLLHVGSRQEWRRWLRRYHGSESEVWLVFHKQHTGAATLSYEDAVEEAMCFGWIDSLVRRVDHARYARKFTPRKADSKWSTANRRRYANLKSRGALAAPGLKRPPTSRSGDAPQPELREIPRHIQKALQRNPRAWQNFRRLAPSYRRAYVGWIEAAKREETKQRRLREALSLLAAGKKLGLK